ncbi:MAG: type II toxin-antitoxin system VapC family toxin [Candidatus Omnitrophica bacterium]|nr:type II toxin-antitoxin system VapC family toxin [Candidatus Omnitrophota bacterium]
MLLVLDSNIYIFGFGFLKDPACEELLFIIAEKPSLYNLRISRAIVKEVSPNLTPENFQKFILFIDTLTKIDEDFLIPFELGAKYEAKGLKPADALIAAYAEWTGADSLITENRHFLFRQNLPFKILSAKNCLKLIKSTS